MLTSPIIFVPLEGCGEDRLEFVCSARDWHWTLDGQMRLDAVWPALLDEMREHVRQPHTEGASC